MSGGLEVSLNGAETLAIFVCDPINASDVSGATDAGALMDLTHFAEPHRAWGSDGDFPAASSAGICDAGTCRIWSWALRTSDTVARARNVVPNGSNTLTIGTETFLADASEVTGDGIGDDDLLCESDEHCWYAPNLGAYQGHGDIVAVPFQDGTLTGIVLQRYALNGYFVP